MQLPPDKIFFAAGSFTAALGIILGAFAAHFLKSHMSREMFDVFEVGVRYHMIHAIALIAVAWAWTRWPSTYVMWAGWMFVAGIILFSGSLYALSLSGVKSFGVITPFGGLLFIIAWALLGLNVITNVI